MACTPIISVDGSCDALRDYLKAKMDAAALEEVRIITTALASGRVKKAPSPVEFYNFYMLAIVTHEIYGRQNDVKRFEQLLLSTCHNHGSDYTAIKPYQEARADVESMIVAYQLPHPMVRYVQHKWAQFHGRKKKVMAVD